MKKALTIKFNIYQDKLDKQNPEPLLIIDTFPENKNHFSKEELDKTNQEVIKLEVSEKREMPERFGRIYYCKIDGELLEKLKRKLK